MNQHLQNIAAIIQQDEAITAEQKLIISKLLKNADKELEIAAFKLDRTEKVKRTTAILLEETIEELEQKRKSIEEANAALTQSLDELKAAQAQLIQSEKMASLGELTAGIAHEIQNPLNFVNNFSEVSKELLPEMKTALDNGDATEAKDIADDVIGNLEKIAHHGKRADTIVKGMLQHSRSSSGGKEPTDINALADEYFQLAYHGIRAKNNSFNAMVKTDFDKTIGKVDIIPQDIGRVLLNLYNNAFYAVKERQSMEDGRLTTADTYQPAISITTKRMDNEIEIKVTDNGKGIPENIIGKIFQPFFTTKPTGQGTGLGLSLSYDIVTKGYGGELKVETKEARPDDPVGQGAGTTFIIVLPVN